MAMEKTEASTATKVSQEVSPGLINTVVAVEEALLCLGFRTWDRGDATIYAKGVFMNSCRMETTLCRLLFARV